MATEGTNKSDEAPPPYQETAAIKDDGQTNTETTSTTQIAPDGEGIFGAPLKRLMWVGGIYLLYCILAFWYPVYYMDYYLNYCSKLCDVDGADAASIAACEQGCDTLDLADAAGADTYGAGWSLITLGIALSAVGVILGYFGVKAGNLLYCQISAGLLGIGGIMQIIGVIIVIAEPEDPEEYFLATLITNWLEVTIPAAIAIILAIDIFNPMLLNDENKRALILSSILFAVGGFMGGILYAYIANWETTYGAGTGIVVTVEFPYKDEFGCIAAGYFIIAICCVVRILMNFQVIKMENAANMVTLKLVISVLLVVGAVVMAAGHWASVDAIYDCDDLTGTCPDYDYEGQHKCYVCGYTFFIIGIAIVNALDMGMVENCKACQAANAAAGGGATQPSEQNQ